MLIIRSCAELWCAFGETPAWAGPMTLSCMGTRGAWNAFIMCTDIRVYPLYTDGELFCFFSLRFGIFFWILSCGACCLLVPWRQPVYSLASIHFPGF